MALPSLRRLFGLEPGRPLPFEAGSRPRVLLASEGRPFGPATLRRVAELARVEGAEVRVLTVARIWGTSLGFPNPWLLPSKHEWQQQRDHVETAIRALSSRGVVASGEVVGTRNAARRIARTAERLGCAAIVMGADPPRSLLIGNLLWAQEPQRVQRRARLPVHLVVETAPAKARAARSRRHAHLRRQP
ncbi:MAG: universal stress protein [Acetobacteraceae bacterium]|nr:universal stress protein [Acetobacteraceae bacterium]